MGVLGTLVLPSIAYAHNLITLVAIVKGVDSKLDAR